MVLAKACFKARCGLRLNRKIHRANNERRESFVTAEGKIFPFTETPQQEPATVAVSF